MNYSIISLLAIMVIVLFTRLIMGPIFDAVINTLYSGWESKIEYLIVLLAILFILVLYLLLKALIYIYRDSKKRNMSPVLWVAVCILFPYLLGFLVYFLVRNPVPLRCPGCQSVVSKEDKFCQQCGLKVATTCKECGGSLPGGAKFCPNCGSQLEA
jgi:RNA polymerase subunit RPABC4/transcription elongation factor Spt4